MNKQFEVSILTVEPLDNGYSPAEYRVGYYETYQEAVTALAFCELADNSIAKLSRVFNNGKRSTMIIRYSDRVIYQ